MDVRAGWWETGDKIELRAAAQAPPPSSLRDRVAGTILRALIGPSIAARVDPAASTVLDACEPKQSVRQLQQRDCSWDADAQTIVVAAPSNAQQPSILVLELCAGFPRLRVEAGDVVLFVRDPDLTLPDGCEFGGDVIICAPEGDPVRPWAMPWRLHVHGHLLIERLAPRDMLYGVQVGGDLAVRVMSDDRAWDVVTSEDLVIGRRLNVRVQGQVHLPEMLTYLDFGLALSGTRIEALPPMLRAVRGSVYLNECQRLESLPQDLTVFGDLHLCDCNSLLTLPEGLTVHGSLIARRCEVLALIPESLHVEGQEMDFGDCRELMALPALPFLQPRFSQLELDVRGTSVVGAHLLQLLSLESDSLLVRHTPLEGVNEADAVANFAAAEREFGVRRTELERHIDPAYRRSVLQFLSKLLASAEFRSEALRPGLKRRVTEVLELIVSDAEASEELVLRMADSLGACADKPIWALGQMQLVAAAARARGDRTKLRSLGRGVMRLGVVHAHAARCGANGGDDVSIHMTFEIRLRDELELPVSSVAVVYGATIPDRLIAAARREALGISNGAFERWLQAWPEWQRQLRLEAIRPYAELELFTGEGGADAALARSLVDDDVQDPVFALPDRSNVWSYADLCAHWVRSGTDFGNKVVPPEDFLGNVVRRLSDEVEKAARVSFRDSLRRRLSIFAKSTRK